MDPFDRVVTALREHGCGVRQRRANQARARCPHHDDRNPSLVVTLKDGKVLMRCWGGCRTSDVLKRIGLRMADLFAGPRDRNAPTPTIIATYDYVDLNGVLVAQKVRFQPKSFRWRRPDPSGRRDWIWGLDGVDPGPYHLPDLIDCHRIFKVEGEKAADYLWTWGVPATCGPTGASRWSEAWSHDLVQVGCRELVILADNDPTGKHHAELVAAMTYQLMPVIVVTLPSLSDHADVFDWLHEGRSIADLENVVLEAGYWHPGRKEQERLARRRAQTRERVRRLRAARRSNAPNVTPCNAVNVQGCNAGNAVTHPERTSDHVTGISIQ